MADDGKQRNFAFADNGLGLVDRWRKVNVLLPMPGDTKENRKNNPVVDYDSPFLRIRHSLKVRMQFKNPETGTIVSVKIIA